MPAIKQRGKSMPLGRLKSPPIEEVVCGFAFEPVPDLDPVILGTYWQERRAEYPGRSLQPPIIEGAVVFSGIGPLRTWFVSPDEAFLIQIQPDRFYLNWRKRGAAYPRFSDEPQSKGVLSRAIEEFERFRQFCSTAVSATPAAKTIDLAKIDHFEEGRDWKDFQDLATLVPLLGLVAKFTGTAEPAVGLRFAETRERGSLLVSLETAVSLRADGQQTRLVKLETRMTKVEVREIRQDFLWANDELNRVFVSLLSDGEITKRFDR